MPTTLYTGKAITISLGAAEFQEQTTAVRITSEDQVDTIELVTGTTVDISKGVKQTLVLEALQDWTEAAGVMNILATAHRDGVPFDFELVITDAGGGTATMTGQAAGVLGDFGGDSGALQATLECPVTTPTYPVVVGGAMADTAKAGDE